MTINLCNQVTDDSAFVNNIDDLLRLMFKDFDNIGEILREVLDPEVSNRFIIFQRGDQKYYIKKSSLLWMLTLVQHKVPKDRVLRFVSTSNKQNVQENLQSGDFVVMKIDDDEKICFVQGFVRKPANKTKKSKQRNSRNSRNMNQNELSSIQLKYGLENIAGNKFLISCQIYQVEDGFLEPCDVQATLIESRNYKRHIYVQRNILTNKITVLS